MRKSFIGAVPLILFGATAGCSASQASQPPTAFPGSTSEVPTSTPAIQAESPAVTGGTAAQVEPGNDEPRLDITSTPDIPLMVTVTTQATLGPTQIAELITDATSDSLAGSDIESVASILRGILSGSLKTITLGEWDEGTLLVEWDLPEGEAIALQDAVIIAQACMESGLPFRELYLSGYAFYEDPGGDVEYLEVLFLFYDRSTIEGIAWEQIDPVDFWALADYGYYEP